MRPVRTGLLSRGFPRHSLDAAVPGRNESVGQDLYLAVGAEIEPGLLGELGWIGQGAVAHATQQCRGSDPLPEADFAMSLFPS